MVHGKRLNVADTVVAAKETKPQQQQASLSLSRTLELECSSADSLWPPLDLISLLVCAILDERGGGQRHSHRSLRDAPGSLPLRM